MGELKREFGKMTIMKGQLEKTVSLERDERQKAQKKLEYTEKQLQESRGEVEKVNEKCENLRK